MVVVVVVILHAGENLDARLDGAIESLPPAYFWPLWRDVGVHGRESVHQFINIVIPEHHLARPVIPFVNRIDK